MVTCPLCEKTWNNPKPNAPDDMCWACDAKMKTVPDSTCARCGTPINLGMSGNLRICDLCICRQADEPFSGGLDD